MAYLMRRLGRGAIAVAIAPLGLLAVLACASLLMLGAFCALLWDCFSAGLDCGKGRRR